MERLLLERTGYLSNGTRGVLFLPSGTTLHTIENPWMDNKARVSCIPEGNYICKPRRYYNGGYDTFEVQDVPDRKYILIHVANTALDVAGCIGVGKTTGEYKDHPAVFHSRDAFFNVFYEEMKEYDAFELQVESVNDIPTASLEQIPTQSIKDTINQGI